MRSTVNACENPLYEKLYHRFSYDGKTVGEMMLCRARATGGIAARERDELRDITAERCITHANLLPREGVSAAATRPGLRPLALLRRNPCALFALFLSLSILSYLLFAGIHHNTPAPEGFLEVGNEADVVYVQTVNEVARAE